MAFSSEIRFKIGADTSAFSKGMVQLQSIAGAANKTIERRFGMKEAFKGILQGVGIGSVKAIEQAVQGPFIRAMETAKEMASLTAATLQSTLKNIGNAGGPQRQLQLQRQELKDMNVDIAAQKKLVADLNGRPLNMFSEASRAAIKEAETGLNEMIKRQAELGAEIDIAVREEKRKTAAITAQANVEGALAMAEIQHKNELEKLDIRRAGLEKEYAVLQKQGAAGSTLAEKQKEIAAVADLKNVTKQAMKEKLDDIRRAGSDAAALAKLENDHAEEQEIYAERAKALYRERHTLQERGADPAALAENQNQIDALDHQHDLFVRNNTEKVSDLQDQMALEKNLTAVQLRDGSDREKNEARIVALQKERRVAAGRGADSAVLTQFDKEIAAIQQENQLLDKRAKEMSATALVGAGQSLLGRRTFADGRPRPRSEAERLADQGQSFVNQAEDAARTGRGPAFVKRLADNAVGKFDAAGNKISASTTGIGKDAGIEALGSKVLETNRILTDINANLKPVDLK